jgi:hypothetical protein
LPSTPERLRPPRDDGDQLSPELALVDPEVAERARDALPDITLTEIRLRLSIKVEQTPAPTAPHSSPEPVAVPEPAPTAAPAPTLVRPADAPAPPPYDEIRRVFHEPRVGPRRLRRSALAGLVIVGVAAGVALALPRALDGPSPQTSASRRSSGGPAAAPAVRREKSKARSKVNAKAHEKAAASPRQHARSTHKAAASPTHHARPAHKVKRVPKKHAAAPPASSRHVSKRKPKAPVVLPLAHALPNFVWAPVKNARGYLVEFLVGSKVVLRVRTRAAKLHVSQLHRGRYRWLVWRVGKSGSPIGKPLVDSNLKVR